MSKMWIPVVAVGAALLLKKSKSKLIKFGAHLDFAGYSGGLTNPPEDILAELIIAEEVGVDIIRIDLNYDAWIQNITERINIFDALVARIKSDGKELMIADAAAESYWSNPIDWNTFKLEYIHRVATLTERYKPEYYVIVKEPSWYMGKWGTSMIIPPKVSTEEWLSLTSELCKVVKSISPYTKCAISISMDGYEDNLFSISKYINGVSNIQQLDIIGFDVYNEQEFKLLNTFIPNLKNKELWILETWTSGEGSGGKSWMKEADANWIRETVSYAVQNGFKGYIPFYSQHFFTYGDIFDISNRTLVFNTYQQLIHEYK